MTMAFSDVAFSLDWILAMMPAQVAANADLTGSGLGSVAAAHGGKERDEYEALLLIGEPRRPVR